MKAERIVVDTNVLISASLNAAGAPRKLIDTILSERNGFCDETFTELESRFNHRKFDKYVSGNSERCFATRSGSGVGRDRRRKTRLP